MPAASSASGRPRKRSPNSPTSASSHCSTAARKPPASRSATAPAWWSTRISAWSSQVFDEPTLASLRGHLAIGHTRYSTTGGSNWENAQPHAPAPPTAGTTDRAGPQRQPGQHRRAGPRGRRAWPRAPARIAPPPTPRWSPRCWPAVPDLSVEAAALEVLPRLRGAFSFVFMDEGTLYAARDAAGRTPAGAGPDGARLGGRQRDGGARHRRAPASSARSSRASCWPSTSTACGRRRFAAPDPKGCLFEYVYLARPDTTIAGRNMYSARVEIGRRLAKEHPVEADLVIPVPESGTPAAIGYAEASGIPYSAGLTKNAYVGPYLHPAVADHPPARHPAQAQPAARGRPRQAAGGGRRLDRARQHPARAGPDAARGRRARGARADLVAAGAVAVLLRHRLRHPGRTDRQRPGDRRHPALDRRRLARVTFRWTGLVAGDRAAARPGSAWPASTGSTRSSCRPAT